jgi:hypothetical protein
MIRFFKILILALLFALNFSYGGSRFEKPCAEYLPENYPFQVHSVEYGRESFGKNQYIHKEFCEWFYYATKDYSLYTGDATKSIAIQGTIYFHKGFLVLSFPENDFEKDEEKRLHKLDIRAFRKRFAKGVSALNDYGNTHFAMKYIGHLQEKDLFLNEDIERNFDKAVSGELSLICSQAAINYPGHFLDVKSISTLFDHTELADSIHVLCESFYENNSLNSFQEATSDSLQEVYLYIDPVSAQGGFNASHSADSFAYHFADLVSENVRREGEVLNDLKGDIPGLAKGVVYTAQIKKVPADFYKYDMCNPEKAISEKHPGIVLSDIYPSQVDSSLENSALRDSLRMNICNEWLTQLQDIELYTRLYSFEEKLPTGAYEIYVHSDTTKGTVEKDSRYSALVTQLRDRLHLSNFTQKKDMTIKFSIVHHKKKTYSCSDQLNNASRNLILNKYYTAPGVRGNDSLCKHWGVWEKELIPLFADDFNREYLFRIYKSKGKVFLQSENKYKPGSFAESEVFELDSFFEKFLREGDEYYLSGELKNQKTLHRLECEWEKSILRFDFFPEKNYPKDLCNILLPKMKKARNALEKYIDQQEHGADSARALAKEYRMIIQHKPFQFLMIDKRNSAAERIIQKSFLPWNIPALNSEHEEVTYIPSLKYQREYCHVVSCEYKEAHLDFVYYSTQRKKKELCSYFIPKMKKSRAILKPYLNELSERKCSEARVECGFSIFHDPFSIVIKKNDLCEDVNKKIRQAFLPWGLPELKSSKEELYYQISYRSPYLDSSEFKTKCIMRTFGRFRMPGTIIPEDRIRKSGVGRRVGKPIIYLYPPEPTAVSVELKFHGTMDYMYPQAKQKDSITYQWEVQADPSGKLTMADKEYYSLFWEGYGAILPDNDSGFLVHSDTLDSFLDNALQGIGLNYKERQEFIVYWSPHLKKNPWNWIHFSFANYEHHAELNVNPAPDVSIRFLMVFRAVQSEALADYQNRAVQVLPTFERKGFTLVEWGGADMGEGMDGIRHLK